MWVEWAGGTPGTANWAISSTAPGSPTRIGVYWFSWRWRCTSSRPRTRVYQSIERSRFETVNEKWRTSAIIGQYPSVS